MSANRRHSGTCAIETLMDYDVDAQIGGKLAMLGSRLIDSTAKSLAEQFFTKFASLMMKQGQPSASVRKAKATKKPAAKKPTRRKPVTQEEGIHEVTKILIRRHIPGERRYRMHTSLADQCMLFSNITSKF